MLTTARDEALDRMVAEAEGMDADAVVDDRYETSEIAGSRAEILAYGTVVRLE